MPAVMRFNADAIRDRFCAFSVQRRLFDPADADLPRRRVAGPRRVVEAVLRDPSTGGNRVAMIAANTRALFDAVP